MINLNNKLKDAASVHIQIKNLSDDKWYDVPVFDFNEDFKEKVAYEFNIYSKEKNDNLYDQLLEAIRSGKFNKRIKMIYLWTRCDYAKYQNMQVVKSWKIITEDKDDFKFHPLLDPMQNVPNIVVRNLGDDEFNLTKGTNMIIQSLLPEATVEISLYWNQEILKTEKS